MVQIVFKPILCAILFTGAAAVDLRYCHGGVDGTCQDITLTTPAFKTCFTPNIDIGIGTVDTIVGVAPGVRYTVHTVTGCTEASSSDTFATGVNNLDPPFLNNVGSISASIAWVSRGCFTDLDAGARTLAAATLTDPNMTVELCQDFCDTGGFAFSGVEFGVECYCDYSVHWTATVTPEAQCGIACGGNPAENCGGPSHIHITTNGKPVPTIPGEISDQRATLWVYQGCFTDNSTGIRTLPTRVEATGGVTPQTCVDACGAIGQVIAGVEFGTECWCGDVQDPDAVREGDIQCGMACRANPAFFCGDANRINIFNALT